MKPLLIAALLLVFSAAHAATCENAELVKGKGWVYTPVPCPVDKEEVAREKACGKDYRALRVGMTLARFEQCYEALSYETETVTKAGTTEIYHSTFYWIQARGGKIVGYTRRTW
jgi:hypothetical protein